jgi:hypothetical protein
VTEVIQKFGCELALAKDAHALGTICCEHAMEIRTLRAMWRGLETRLRSG